MVDLYVKSESGQYFPVKLNNVDVKHWKDCIILVKVGNNDIPATPKEEDMVFEALADCDLENIDNINFLITAKDIDFKNLGNKNVIKERLLKGDDIVDILSEE